MTYYKTELDRELDRFEAKELRRRSHVIYQLPNGEIISRSCTPSAQNAEKRAISELRKRAALPNRQNRKQDAIKEHALLCGDELKIRPYNRPSSPPDPGLLFFHKSEEQVFTARQSNQTRTFASLDSLVDALALTDEFWGLDGCAKTRIFSKLATGFATVQIVGVSFNWFDTISIVKTDELRPDQRRALLDSTFNNIWLDHCQLWKHYARPATWLQFPNGKSMVIDFQAPTHIGYREQINMVDCAFDSEGTFAAPWPMWKQEQSVREKLRPDHLVTYCFANSLGMSKWGITIQYRETYTVPRHTQTVLRTLLEI